MTISFPRHFRSTTLSFFDPEKLKAFSSYNSSGACIGNERGGSSLGDETPLHSDIFISARMDAGDDLKISRTIIVSTRMYTYIYSFTL